jgi:hypothetical protein
MAYIPVTTNSIFDITTWQAAVLLLLMRILWSKSFWGAEVAYDMQKEFHDNWFRH